MAGRLVEKILGPYQLADKPFACDSGPQPLTAILGVCRQVGVREGVIPDFVTVENRLSHQGRIVADESAGQEQRDSEVEAAEEVEQLGGAICGRTSIERQRNSGTGIRDQAEVGRRRLPGV